MAASRRTLLRRLFLNRAVLLAAAALAAAAVALGVLWAVLPDPAPLARTNPRTTAMIEQRRAEARAKGRTLRVRQAWVGLDRVSKRMLDAVILSEDANFFGHEGIDWEAIRLAAEHDLEKGRFARGASTITQQLAKNLWFGTEKSLTRKAKEAVLAMKLERAMSKRRILALYLNVAEFGDGVFGVEAGARARFGTSAAALSAAQAAVLASLLPAPRRVDLAHPSTWLQRRSRRLLDRMLAAGRISADEHRHASAELERILAGPRPQDDEDEPPEEAPPVVEPRVVELTKQPITATVAEPDPNPNPNPNSNANPDSNSNSNSNANSNANSNSDSNPDSNSNSAPDSNPGPSSPPSP